MYGITQAISELVKNGAFWTFLGVCVTSYFGYKEVARRSPTAQKKNVKAANSFEELRAVVEVLQDELHKKDRRHKDDTDYMLAQLTEARHEVQLLNARYSDALHRATQAEEVAQKCGSEVRRLRKLLLANGISE